MKKKLVTDQDIGRGIQTEIISNSRMTDEALEQVQKKEGGTTNHKMLHSVHQSSPHEEEKVKEKSERYVF